MTVRTSSLALSYVTASHEYREVSEHGEHWVFTAQYRNVQIKVFHIYCPLKKSS